MLLISQDLKNVVIYFPSLMQHSGIYYVAQAWTLHFVFTQFLGKLLLKKKKSSLKKQSLVPEADSTNGRCVVSAPGTHPWFMAPSSIIALSQVQKSHFK